MTVTQNLHTEHLYVQGVEYGDKFVTLNLLQGLPSKESHIGLEDADPAFSGSK